MIVSIGTLGATADKVAGTSIALGTTAAATAGNLVVVLVSKDNAAAADGNSDEITSVTDSAGNSYAKAVEYCKASGAADAGVTAAIYYGVLASDLPPGGTITADFSDSRVAKAISAWAWSGNAIELDGANGIGGTNSNTSIDVTCGFNAQHVVVRGVGTESASLLTPAHAGWTNLSSAATAGSSGHTNAGVSGLWQIAPGSSYTSNPNSGGAGVDSAILIAAFKEATVPVVRTPARHSCWL